MSQVQTVCPHCRNSVPSAAFCSNCGSKLSNSGEGLDDRYSSLRQRILAHVIDIPFVVVSDLLGVLAARAVAASSWIPEPPHDPTIQAQAFDPVTAWNAEPIVLKIGFFAVIFLWQGLAYYSLCHSSDCGATLGKRWQGILVIDKKGDRVTLARALGREFSKILINVFSALLPGTLVQLLVMSSDSKRRAIHDSVAGTVVVRVGDPGGARIGAWRIVVSIVLPVFATAAFAAGMRIANY